MYTLDFSNPNQNIHFIGIGGISMSALAEILKQAGFQISGSDMRLSALTNKLSKMGITIHEGHDSKNIQTADVVVYTAAVKADNPEFAAAKQNNLPMLDRAELLGQIMDNYEYSIAVAGTHGKTTTTSMVSHILLEAEVNPTIHVGGELDAIGGNVLVGENKYFITEACEYADSFLKFSPFVGIILNIEADHLDYFKDLNHILSSFLGFTKRIDERGYLVINIDEAPLSYFKGALNCNILTYSLSNGEADFTAQNITYSKQGYASFQVIHRGTMLGEITLSVPGIHNVSNALSAIAAATALGIPFAPIQKGLLQFRGTHRRFEYKGTIKGMTVVDDYAHHPTEIKATLQAAKNYPHKKVWCIFQPHTYSRTKSLLQEFSTAFTHAHEVIITDIYAAREKDPKDIHSKDLTEAIKKYNKNTRYISSFEDIVKYLLKNGKDGDLLITMGAGDVLKIGEMLLDTDLSTLSTDFSTAPSI